jgi:hypothetical protein
VRKKNAEAGNAKAISVKISEDDYDWLADMAKKEDRTISNVMRLIIRSFRNTQPDATGIRLG